MKDALKKFKSGIIPKIIVAALIVYISVAILDLRVQIGEKKQQASSISKEIDLLSEENESMRNVLVSELSEEQIRQIAREKLGLVAADDEVYYNITSNN